MAKILCIESAGDVCSVALSVGGAAQHLRESTLERDHAKLLAVFIREVLEESALSAHDLDAVAISHGPGSYTSLRIGVATAKGLCFAAQKPLIAIGSLAALAQIALSATQSQPHNAVICALIDARRMEVYHAFFDAEGAPLSEVAPLVVEPHSFDAQLQQHRVFFVGSGAEKCRQVVEHPNATFLPARASAVGLAALAQKAFDQQQFEDLAYFEPFYLKNFVALHAKNKFF